MRSARAQQLLHNSRGWICSSCIHRSPHFTNTTPRLKCYLHPSSKTTAPNASRRQSALLNGKRTYATDASRTKPEAQPEEPSVVKENISNISSEEATTTTTTTTTPDIEPTKQQNQVQKKKKRKSKKKSKKTSPNEKIQQKGSPKQGLLSGSKPLFNIPEALLTNSDAAHSLARQAEDGLGDSSAKKTVEAFYKNRHILTSLADVRAQVDRAVSAMLAIQQGNNLVQPGLPDSSHDGVHDEKTLRDGEHSRPLVRYRYTGPQAGATSEKETKPLLTALKNKSGSVTRSDASPSTPKGPSEEQRKVLLAAIAASKSASPIIPPASKTKKTTISGADTEQTAETEPSCQLGQSKAIPLAGDVQTITAQNLTLTPVDSEQPPVPTLAYGLDRVLFNAGVYQLQDSRTQVYNFDPYLQNIMPVAEFDFDALKEYITSSKDQSLDTIAKQAGKKYTGSTSSMTSTLAHFHYILSQWRDVNTAMLSEAFPAYLKSFTALQRAPAAIFLKWQNGTYAIDADKEHATANVLSMLGKSMEKLLTLDTSNFERYRKINSDQITPEERDAPEAYHFSTLGDFLMRSQLDAYDPRLPGTGMFDLKTRAVVSVRMHVQDYKNLRGYEIWNRFGEWESYEREYYDMIRSAFLKYSLQVRMGRMDGIFVAFHNTERIFGFQYVPLSEMDYALHGTQDTTLGDSEFKLSLKLLNKVLNKATERFPEQNIRLHVETRDTKTNYMYIFAEPCSDEHMHEIQSANDETIRKFERDALELDSDDLIKDLEAKQQEANKVEENDYDEDDEVSFLAPDEQDVHVASGAKSGTELLDNVDNASNLVNDDESSLEAPNVPDTAVGSSAPNSSDDVAIAEHSSIDDVHTNSIHPDVNTEVSELQEQVTDSSTTFFGKNLSDSITTDVLDELEPSTPVSKTKSKRAPRPPEPHLDEKGNVKPLLGMILTIQNRIGGSPVLRPMQMSADSAKQRPWTVDYTLQEMESPAKAWNLYNMCQARRRKALRVDEDKNKLPLIRMLRAMAAKHKQQRNKLDKETQGNEKVVVGATLQKAES